MEVLVTPPALIYVDDINCLVDCFCENIMCSLFDVRFYPFNINNWTMKGSCIYGSSGFSCQFLQRRHFYCRFLLSYLWGSWYLFYWRYLTSVALLASNSILPIKRKHYGNFNLFSWKLFDWWRCMSWVLDLLCRLALWLPCTMALLLFCSLHRWPISSKSHSFH